MTTTRRRFIAGAAATAAAGSLPAPFVRAAKAPIRVGILLPYSGTFAMLGEAITDAMKLRIAEAGGSIAGRDLAYIPIDSEMSPEKAPQNTKKLIAREGVDFLIGPVHSGVAMAMAREVRGRERPLLIIPNAGANAITREWCAPNVFRASYTNWQTSYPCGKVIADDGHKTLVTITWKYAAGEEHAGAAAEHFEALGGTTVKKIFCPFPDVEFQAYLSEIASLQPDAVFAFFAGGGAVKFVKDYAAAGLKDRIPLYSNGFITEGLLPAQGAAAEGIKSTLHWAETLETPANTTFMAAYQAATGRAPDVYAMQGYDTGELIVRAVEAVGGEIDGTAEMIRALEAVELAQSPRGAWRMSKAHNPIQTFYVRTVENGVHKILGVASPDLEDPATGCAIA